MGEDRKSEYVKKLRDVRWQQMRLKVLERDGWRCRQCQLSEGVSLQVHHSYYTYGADPWDYPESSLITLCEDCHEYESARSSATNRRLVVAVRTLMPFCDQVEDLVEMLAGGGNGLWKARALITHTRDVDEFESLLVALMDTLESFAKARNG